MSGAEVELRPLELKESASKPTSLDASPGGRNRVQSEWAEVLDWLKHPSSTTKRKAFVITLYTISVTLIIFGIAYDLSRTSTDTQIFRSSLNGINYFSISVDNCKVDIYADSQVTAGAVNVVLRVSNFDGVRVTHSSASGVLSYVVQDERTLGERYESYYCQMDVQVGPNTILPDTAIIVLGTLSSVITSESVSWGTNSLSLSAEHVRDTNIQAYFQDLSLGQFNMTMERGHVRLLDANLTRAGPSGGIFVNLNKPEARFVARLNSSVRVPLVSTVSPCLTSMNNNCTSTYCDLKYLYNDNSDSSFWPVVNAQGNGALHVLSAVARWGTIFSDSPNAPTSEPFRHPPVPPLPPFLDDDTFLQLTTTYPSTSFSTFNRIIPAFPASDAARLAAASDNDVLIIHVQGPGVAPVVFAHSSTRFYLVMPSSFLDIFSWGLLTPSTKELNVTLIPGFCPGMQWMGLKNKAYSEENVYQVHQLISSAIGGNFKQMTYSYYENVYDWKGPNTKFQILPGFLPGEYTVSSVHLSNSGKIIATIVLNLLVSFAGAIYVMFLILFPLRAWFINILDMYGLSIAATEESWAKTRAKIIEHANLFFWTEFLIEYPSRNHRSYWQMALTVALHLFVVALPVAPVCVGLGFFFRYGFFSQGSFYFVFAILFFIMVIVDVALSIVLLFLYYAGLHRNPLGRFLGRLHMWFTAFVGFFSVVYVVNVAFWVLLGVVLKPNLVLPLAAVVIVIASTIYASSLRVIQLRRQLETEIKERARKEKESKNADNSVPAASLTPSTPADDKEVTKNIRFDVSNPKNTIQDIIGLVSVSKLLEIAGASVWERIWMEIMLVSILVLTMAFLAVGFWVMSTNTQFVSAVSTIVVFIIGGGINIPIHTWSSAGDYDRLKFMQRVRAHVEDEQKKKN